LLKKVTHDLLTVTSRRNNDNKLTLSPNKTTKLNKHSFQYRSQNWCRKKNARGCC